MRVPMSVLRGLGGASAVVVSLTAAGCADRDHAASKERVSAPKAAVLSEVASDVRRASGSLLREEAARQIERGPEVTPIDARTVPGNPWFLSSPGGTISSSTTSPNFVGENPQPILATPPRPIAPQPVIAQPIANPRPVRGPGWRAACGRG
jgi:hypothetical protein